MNKRLSYTTVGPCALDYSKTKTQDHFWTDPPADELVQRHRISSGHATPPSCRRPALNVSDVGGKCHSLKLQIINFKHFVADLKPVLPLAHLLPQVTKTHLIKKQTKLLVSLFTVTKLNQL
jgi:hypothetical protein